MSDTTKRIRRAALLVAAGILVSRLLGFLRDVVIASRLGDTPEADAYTAAFILPNFLNYLLAGGFLAITFIPILSKHLANDDREGAAAALGAVFRPLAVVIVALTAIGMVFTEPIVKLLFEDSIGPRFTAEIVTLTRLVLPAQVFFVLGGLYTAVQYAHGRFLIPTLAPIIYNACIILGGIVGSSGPRHWLYGPDGEIIGEGGLLSLVTRPPAQGFIVGAVIGAFLGNFLLQWWGARRTRLRMSGGALSFTDQRFREYLLLAIPLMVGQSIVVLDESLGSFFAAYANSGSIYSLNLARRVNMLPVGVIAQAAGVAAYPFFARLVAEQRFSEMRDTMGRTIRSVVFVSGLAVAIVIAVSQPAIRVAFLHGEFRLEGVRLTSAALVAYALSIPAWGVHQVFARAFLRTSPDVVARDRRHGVDGRSNPLVSRRIQPIWCAGSGGRQLTCGHWVCPNARLPLDTAAHDCGSCGCVGFHGPCGARRSDRSRCRMARHRRHRASNLVDRYRRGGSPGGHFHHHVGLRGSDVDRWLHRNTPTCPPLAQRLAAHFIRSLGRLAIFALDSADSC